MSFWRWGDYICKGKDLWDDNSTLQLSNTLFSLDCLTAISLENISQAVAQTDSTLLFQIQRVLCMLTCSRLATHATQKWSTKAINTVTEKELASIWNWAVTKAYTLCHLSFSLACRVLTTTLLHRNPLPFLSSWSSAAISTVAWSWRPFTQASKFTCMHECCLPMPVGLACVCRACTHEEGVWSEWI